MPHFTNLRRFKTIHFYLTQMKQNLSRSNTSSTVPLPADFWHDMAEAASRFAYEWAHETDEKGEAHSFRPAFLSIGDTCCQPSFAFKTKR